MNRVLLKCQRYKAKKKHSLLDYARIVLNWIASNRKESNIKSIC